MAEASNEPNGHLAKAKAALADAKDVTDNEKYYHRLLDVAQVQANMAAAEALTRIADLLEERRG